MGDKIIIISTTVVLFVSILSLLYLLSNQDVKFSHKERFVLCPNGSLEPYKENLTFICGSLISLKPKTFQYYLDLEIKNKLKND